VRHEPTASERLNGNANGYLLGENDRVYAFQNYSTPFKDSTRALHPQEGASASVTADSRNYAISKPLGGNGTATSTSGRQYFVELEIPADKTSNIVKCISYDNTQDAEADNRFSLIGVDSPKQV
jgi:hypothetical protein